MTSHHQTDRVQRAYERLLKRVPAGVAVDYSLIQNLADLRFQLEHQIDLFEEGDEPSIKSPAQLHRVKMLLADIGIAQQDEARR